MNTCWVMIGAIAGAPARYLLDRAIQTRHRRAFPYGTFAVNMTACFLLGLITELVTRGAPTELQLIAGTGFCATFSTYSTFSVETTQLARRGEPLLALSNAVGSTVIGSIFAMLGVAVALAVT
ncbi:fluoride efflux transporter CrcB [Allobranchiibius sp. GilTou73]|uniref:fluoride efflux transporter CrcB n=1 Tax=Allobranchiibius sp. GilTou73 TaxID=2904523 RepID=UPI001F3CB464|nr:fluoride efflux transporter CrcB [Allobranchiibius sp. GilTou73]UIJ36561.1 fluoride efflux transporter CrcB [Allobranchiibius sp. GilTou73]